MVNETNLFKSIYDNANGYRKSIRGIIGSTNYIFEDDIISRCIEKLIVKIRNGDLDVKDVCYKNTNTINHSYFNKLITNESYDKRKSKSSGHKSAKFIPQLIEEEVIPDQELLDKDDKISFIEDKLTEFQKGSKDKKYHADIFRYLSIYDISMSELSRESGITVYYLLKSREYMKPIVNDWAKQELKNKTMVKVRAVIGKNKDGEQIVFPSCNAAKKEGYGNLKNAIEKNRVVKGFTFSYVDTEPEEEFKTVEAAAKTMPYNGDVPKRLLTLEEVEYVENILNNVPKRTWNYGLIRELYTDVFGKQHETNCGHKILSRFIHIRCMVKYFRK